MSDYRSAQKFHSIRFSLTAVVALLILISVFFTSAVSYYRYTEDFKRQSSEQIEQTLEQLSINLSAYIDERIGIIKVDASYDGIAAIVEKVDMGKDGGIYIVDSDQNLIYNSLSSRQSALLSEVVVSSSGAWTQKIDGSKYLINTVKVQNPDWTIVSVNSLQELTKNAQKTRNFTFILATLSSCTAIIVLLFFTHRILHPLMQIVQLMKEVRNGNFHVSFTPKRNDEIGYLGESFNKMTETINDNIRRNTELTTKVYQTEMLHTQARLHALQNQIKPHFLYNTLNMISMQIQVGRTTHAVSNIDRLHHLLRGMAKLDQEAPVEEEFSLLHDYLAIQSSRFEGRLDYQLKLDDTMRQRYILTFILQPLVENAVIHGCEKQRRHTFILVEGFCRDEKSYFTIKDTGKGMSASIMANWKPNPCIHLSTV